MDDSLIRLPDIQFPEGFPKDTPLYVNEEEGHAVSTFINMKIFFFKLFSTVQSNSFSLCVRLESACRLWEES